MLPTDPRSLAAGPYRTPGPLAARAAIYAWQHPAVDLVAAAAAALADLPAGALVVDAGSGPGRYLHRLRPDLRRLAVDVSPGMLRAVEDDRVLRAVGSTDALPLPDQAADAALAMHMLYHLPDPQAGLAELRRVVRPGGRLVVSTNDETDGLWDTFRAAGVPRPPVSARWPLAAAPAAVRAAGFADVRLQAFDYVLDVPAAEPVLAYLDSCRTGFADVADEAWAGIRRAVAATVTAEIRRHGSLRRPGRVGIVAARG